MRKASLSCYLDVIFNPDLGLVVLEAKYGAADQDENARELIIDVTVPLQALVHHSQVNIPGHRTKVGTSPFITRCIAFSTTFTCSGFLLPFVVYMN